MHIQNIGGRGSPQTLMPQMVPTPQALEEADEEDEELGHAETYAEYMPSKCKFTILFF